MRIVDFLVGVGHVVAYYPSLRKVTGSINASILLCQLAYWTGKQKDPSGWISKTSDEIEEETALTYKEQITARKYLVERGLMEEHYARLDHELRFRLALGNLQDLWEHMPKGQFGSDESVSSYNELEITTEKNTGYAQKLPLDWKIATGKDITEDDLSAEKDRKMIDASNIIATTAGARRGEYYDISYAFQKETGIVLTDHKKNRKAIKDMLENGVTVSHVLSALEHLSSQKVNGKKLTIADLMAVKKTAIIKAVSGEDQKKHKYIEGV